MAQILSLEDERSRRSAAEERERAEAEGLGPENRLSGLAKCLACGHEWIAVVSVGQDSHDLVCPKCDTRRGQLVYPPGLDENDVTWTHRCGSRYYTVLAVKRSGWKVPSVAYANTAESDVEMRIICLGCGEDAGVMIPT